MKNNQASDRLFVISLGGSLIVPKEIDESFLGSFKKLIVKHAKKGNKFIISPGGGMTCRKYQAALKRLSKTSPEDLDWIGLFTNKFHSKFLALVFKEWAETVVAEDPNKKVQFEKSVLIGAGGWKPGRSSDDFSVRLAKVYGAKTVINLSNIDYVYDKDPKKHNDAKHLKKISWKEMRKIVGSRWVPGANLPFDPTAAALAEKDGIGVVIANGKDLKNFENILNGKTFRGTLIK